MSEQLITITIPLRDYINFSSADFNKKEWEEKFKVKLIELISSQVEAGKMILIFKGRVQDRQKNSNPPKTGKNNPPKGSY